MSDETLLFVDVDGVLNVGVLDPSSGGMELTQPSIDYTRRVWSDRYRLSTEQRECVERMLATSERSLGSGAGVTYEQLTSNPLTGVSDVLVCRLALLIRCLGPNVSVVLSSSWRHPRYAARVEKLEDSISMLMGVPFRFKASTDVCDDRKPGRRLENIGNFLFRYCQELTAGCQVRVLVLDDFNVNAVGSWSCGGLPMDTVDAMGEYLEQQAPAHVNVSAKVLHTYDEFVAPGGLHVQVGAGLSWDHVCLAWSFARETGTRFDKTESNTTVYEANDIAFPWRFSLIGMPALVK